MRTFRFDKLVRDKILDQQLARGAKVDFRKLNDTEFLDALKDKLLEEAAELKTAAKADILEELADVQEVVDTILQQIGHDKTSLRAAQTKKNAQKGSFKHRLYIEKVANPDNDPWVAYYEQNADRYPEIIDE